VAKQSLRTPERLRKGGGAQAHYAGGWHTTSTGTFPIQSSGSAYALLKGASPGSYRVQVVFSGSVISLDCTSPWAYLRIT
jgi:hypothetical protein